MSQRTRLFAICAILALLILGVITVQIVLRTGGLWYSLDDPYIHLRLSELIRHGEYGINHGEMAAPSSSILFPFLLAPLAGTVLHPYLPLVLGIAATVLSLWFLSGLVLTGAEKPRVHLLLLSAAFVLTGSCAFNLFGVVFTGLEHPLHIAVSLGIVLGCIRAWEEGAAPRWLLPLIVLCPLLRFEGLALSGIAILLLATRQHWRTALAATVLLALTLLGWYAFTRSLGLPLMPSSVTTKSRLVADAVAGSGSSVLAGLRGNAREMISTPYGLNLLALAGMTLALLAAAAISLRKRGMATCLRLAVLVTTVIAAHALAGRYGWFARYELYAKFICLAAIVWTLFGRPGLAVAPKTVGARSRRLREVAGIVFTVVIAGFTIENGLAGYETQAQWLTPLAAHNIYAQQAQMARFAHDYARVPVAVNDLGLVSYRSEQYVLDLWGLGSEEVRRARARSGGSTDWMDALTMAHGVRLAMVYKTWFQRVPQPWCRLGELQLLDPLITPAEATVAFFATSRDAAPALNDALRAFAPTLPGNSRFMPALPPTADRCLGDEAATSP